jgi:hyaluronan synthase
MSAPGLSERRLFKRFDLVIPVKVQCDGMNAALNQLKSVNISYGGARLLQPRGSTTAINPGDSLFVDFRIPPVLANLIVRSGMRIGRLPGTIVDRTETPQGIQLSLKFRFNLIDFAAQHLKMLPFSPGMLWPSFKRFLGQTPLLFLSSIMISTGIILVKAFTIVEGDWWIKVYSFIVITFIMSRVTASILYRFSAIARWKEEKKFIPFTFEPHVSFVIPVKNEEAVIESTIRKCFEVDYPEEKIHVIVIDDGSDDSTWSVIQDMEREFPNLTAIRFEANRGKRHAMCAGILAAEGSELVLQLDSDSYMEGKTFRELINPFYDPQVGAVAAHAEPANSGENLLTKMQHAYYFMSFRLLKAAESCFGMVFCCSGCCSAYRRSAILPFLDQWKDETFLGVKTNYGDDRALTNLVIEAGYETLYASGAVSYTYVPNRFRKFVRQQVRWKKGWFINSVRACRIVFRRDRFVAVTYFYPLCLITLLTPVMAFRALIYNPLFNGTLPTFYLLGVFCVTSLLVIHYKYHCKNNYGLFLYLWSLINTFFLSFILIYALLKIRDNRWGTR